MQRIGLLGGMSWQSTAVYYRRINEEVQRLMGGLHSAEILLDSVEFGEVELQQRAGQWSEIGRTLAQRAMSLERAGAACLMICSNTTHRVADAISRSLSIPLLHIVDAVDRELGKVSARKVAVIATGYTIASRVYQEGLVRRGVEVIIPDTQTQGQIDAFIYDELCCGKLLESSRQRLTSLIDAFHDNGADAVVLACTELGMLVPVRTQMPPIIDSTEAHIRAAIEFLLPPSSCDASEFGA